MDVLTNEPVTRVVDEVIEDGYILSTHYIKGILSRKEYRLNGKLHRLDGPAIISYYKTGKLYAEEYYLYDQRHRPFEEGPAYIGYYETGNIYLVKYFVDGEMSRSYTYKPDVVIYYENGLIKYEWYGLGENYDDNEHDGIIENNNNAITNQA